MPFPCASPPVLSRVEEQTLQDKMQAEHHEDGFDMDEASHRLNEIYERMNEVRHTTQTAQPQQEQCSM